MEIEIKDWNKTKATLYHGPHRFCLHVVWLKKAPETFQKIENVILTNLKWQFFLIHLIDIFIFSKTLETNLNPAKHILTLLQRAEVKRNLETRSFAKDTIGNLQHVIWLRCLKIAVHNDDAIQELKTPRNNT